jgi:aquaporin Z
MLYPILSEYIGTLLLIGVIAFVGNPLAIVAALWVAIVTVGQMSGGHFNPAVTVWAYLSGKVNGTRALAHTLAQIAAAATIWVIKY